MVKVTINGEEVAMPVDPDEKRKPPERFPIDRRPCWYVEIRESKNDRRFRWSAQDGSRKDKDGSDYFLCSGLPSGYASQGIALESALYVLCPPRTPEPKPWWRRLFG